MEDLDIEVKNGTPLIGEYVIALNELAFKYRDSMALFWMLTYSVNYKPKARSYWQSTQFFATIYTLSGFVSMVQPDNPQYDTWENQLLIHSALQDMVAEQRGANVYQKHLDSYGAQSSSSATGTSKSKPSVAQR